MCFFLSAFFPVTSCRQSDGAVTFAGNLSSTIRRPTFFHFPFPEKVIGRLHVEKAIDSFSSSSRLRNETF